MSRRLTAGERRDTVAGPGRRTFRARHQPGEIDSPTDPRFSHEGAAQVTLLETISGPRELKQLPADQLPVLASEIRDVLIETVSRTSGHLGPNLGVVELTIALHRVFDSPVDSIIYDVGHQAYVHKLLTGRHAQFGTLRQGGGISGEPRRGGAGD